MTTPGAPGLPVISGDSVTPGDSVRPVFTGQEAQKEKIDKRLDRSELPILNSPSRSVQLEHNVHMHPGNMPNLQTEHLLEYSEVFQEHSPASMIRHLPPRSRSRSYDSVSPRRHSRLTSRSRGKKKKKHSKSHSSKRDKSKKKHKRKKSPSPPPSPMSSKFFRFFRFFFFSSEKSSQEEV